MSRKTVLVTGCSDGGLGAELAIAFHKAGYRVIATARNLSKASQTKALGIEQLELEATSEESIRKCVQELSNLTDAKLDILVNNAGQGYSMPIVDVELPKIRDLFELNVFSIIGVSRAFLPLLRASGQGMIVNNTSIAALTTVPFQGAYCASKAAAGHMTEILRLELAPFGIKVVDLKTGAIRTGFYDQLNANDKPAKLPPTSIYQIAADAVETAMGGEGMMAAAANSTQWAQGVVSDLSRPNPPYQIWRGSDSTIVRIFCHLPLGLLDFVFKRRFGLYAVEEKVNQQNQISQSRSKVD